MTKFYEVRRRDGAARIGFLSLNGEKKQTPLLFHVESLSSGDEGFEVLSVEDANFNDLFQEDLWDVPRGAVLVPEVHPLRRTMEEAVPSLCVDCFVLSFASAMLNSPTPRYGFYNRDGGKCSTIFHYAWLFKRLYGCIDRNKWAANCFEVHQSREFETNYSGYNAFHWNTCDLEFLVVGVEGVGGDRRDIVRTED